MKLFCEYVCEAVVRLKTMIKLSIAHETVLKVLTMLMKLINLMRMMNLSEELFGELDFLSQPFLSNMLHCILKNILLSTCIK